MTKEMEMEPEFTDWKSKILATIRGDLDYSWYDAVGPGLKTQQDTTGE
jgi:hypothetical protein